MNKLGLAAWVVAIASCGCNAILGIDEATPDVPDASAGGAPGTAAAGTTATTGAGGASGASGAGGGDAADTADGSACPSLTASGSCNRCAAQQCCDLYEACVKDANCKKALADYNTCVGINFTNDAGGTCDEAFDMLGPLEDGLATCAFLNGSTASPPGCFDACHGRPLGQGICDTYCKCMADTCPEKAFEGGGCSTVCDEFTANQLTCRPYHCGLAQKAQGAGDEPGRIIHCGHAAGEALCL